MPRPRSARIRMCSYARTLTMWGTFPAEEQADGLIPGYHPTKPATFAEGITSRCFLLWLACRRPQSARQAVLITGFSVLTSRGRQPISTGACLATATGTRVIPPRLTKTGRPRRAICTFGCNSSDQRVTRGRHGTISLCSSTRTALPRAPRRTLTAARFHVRDLLPGVHPRVQ